MRQPRQTEKLNFIEADESARIVELSAARYKISLRQIIIRPSRQDNIVNRELNYFGEPKAIYHLARLLFSTAVFSERGGERK